MEEVRHAQRSFQRGMHCRHGADGEDGKDGKDAEEPPRSGRLALRDPVKRVYRLPADATSYPRPLQDWGGRDGGGPSLERRELRHLNHCLHEVLVAHKNEITQYYRNRKWDRCKKYTNDYELVFTTSPDFPSIAAHSPISRSFFKMWEILHDFEADIGAATAPAPMRAAFLAEGPGGFVEAFARYRGAAYTQRREEDGGGGGGNGGAATEAAEEGPLLLPPLEDDLHGMTLLSRNRNVPPWKLPAPYSDTLHMHRGVDGTGDLYNLANIDHMASEVGEGSCHLVTADGGFDFSGDYNGQEEKSLELITCEVYAALRLLGPGGAFVLKVYDMRMDATLRLMYMLRCSFRDMFIVKPLTSRPANSEKYIVCTRFSATTPDGERRHRDLLAKLRTDVAARNFAFEWAEPPVAFLRDILNYNLHYVRRQAASIARTLALIQEVDRRREDAAAAARANLARQLDCSVRWCRKYGSAVSASALRRYRQLFGLAAPVASGHDDHHRRG